MTEANAEMRITPDVLAHLRTWTGKTEERQDEVTAAPVAGLSATLDIAAPAAGDELPPIWHWLYFLPNAPQSELGADGHPRLGGFLPPVPLSRRMWAGSRIQWLAPLRVGDRMQRVSTIQSLAHKAGRSGDLVFVTVRHEISRGGELAIREEQDIVYRAPARPGDPAPAPQAAPTDATWKRDMVADPVLLFRFSALTFNAHRIHYDRTYAKDVEQYPGLVVHGPLQATLLLDLVRRQQPQARLASFSFRAMSPIFDGQPFQACGAPQAGGARLWTQGANGHLAMQAEAQFQ